MADFLLFLRDEKKFTVPTVKGYRSALSLVLRPSGVNVTESPELTALVRSFSQEVPARSLALPKWDLSLVLGSLTRPPYEPLETADQGFLTHKCVFLIALASAKRVSEIQALSGEIFHRDDWSEVSFQFAPDFLAKTEVPDAARAEMRTFLIPALRRHASDPEDLLLCPVRTLRCYLSRTRDRRQPASRLFLPVSGVRQAVSKNTISSWISSVVRRAYAADNGAQHRLYSVSAHEVRALATSWRFSHNLALDSVMAAASWRSHSTFSSFYLRDVSLVADGVHALGPIVAAQSVVQPVLDTDRSFRRNTGGSSDL